jgi:hypothetical protein
MTRWGAVQVQLTVKDGQITKSEVIQIPWDNPRDQQINSYAVPILNKEVVTSQTASIDMVSGATVTSVGYIQSLQSRHRPGPPRMSRADTAPLPIHRGPTTPASPCLCRAPHGYADLLARQGNRRPSRRH